MIVFSSTDAELKSVTREMNETRSRIEKFVVLRRQLDDELFLLSQEQLTSDKSAQNAHKAILVRLMIQNFNSQKLFLHFTFFFQQPNS
jgi:hypothetical protein